MKKKETKVDSKSEFFTEDKGVTRASKMAFNSAKIEEILADARKFLDDERNKSPPVASLLAIEQRLGVDLSCANNFAWMFNPSNKHAPFRDLAIKYNIKVGAHTPVVNGQKPKEKQSNYFREMTKAENG